MRNLVLPLQRCAHSKRKAALQRQEFRASECSTLTRTPLLCLAPQPSSGVHRPQAASFASHGQQLDGPQARRKRWLGSKGTKDVPRADRLGRWRQRQRRHGAAAAARQVSMALAVELVDFVSACPLPCNWLAPACCAALERSRPYGSTCTACLATRRTAKCAIIRHTQYICQPPIRSNVVTEDLDTMFTKRRPGS